MSIVDQAKQPEDRPLVVTLLGENGLGKTTTAATWPKPVVIRAEDGVNGVPKGFRPDALPVINRVEDLWDQLKALCSEEHDYKTVIIDSITQLEQMFIQKVVDNDPKVSNINQANGGYGAGREAVATMHRRVRKAADVLVSKGMHVVFIAHADIAKMDPPDGDPYTRYELRLHRTSVSPYTDNVDVVGYLKLQTYTTGDGDRKQAVTDGQRVLVTYATPSNVSKNRLHITEDLPVSIGVNPLADYVEEYK